MTAAALTGAGNVTNSFTTAGSSLTINVPSLVATNDLLMAICYQRNAASTFATLSGWTLLNSNGTNGGFYLFAHYVSSGGGEPVSYTFTQTGGGSRCGGIIWRVINASTTPLDAAGTAVTTGTGSLVGPAVAAVSSAPLLIACWAAQRSNADAIITTPSGMSQVANLDFTNGAAAHTNIEVDQLGLTASGSTGTQTATISPVADSGTGFMVTIAPAPFTAATPLILAQSVKRAAYF